MWVGGNPWFDELRSSLFKFKVELGPFGRQNTNRTCRLFLRSHYPLRASPAIQSHRKTHTASTEILCSVVKSSLETCRWKYFQGALRIE